MTAECALCGIESSLNENLICVICEHDNMLDEQAQEIARINDDAILASWAEEENKRMEIIDMEIDMDIIDIMQEIDIVFSQGAFKQRDFLDLLGLDNIKHAKGLWKALQRQGKIIKKSGKYILVDEPMTKIASA
jgi:hypothetical protein